MKTLVFALLAALAISFAGCGKTTELGKNGTRRYYIAAEPVDWAYAPERFAPYSSAKPISLAAAQANYPFYTTTVERNGDGSNVTAVRVGKTYRKFKFVAYKDESFNDKKAVDDDLGLFGPVVRAQEGDTVEIWFKDRTEAGVELEFPGTKSETWVKTEKSDGRVLYTGAVDSVLVAPNLDRDLNPAKAYFYQAKEPAHREAGLQGPMVFYAKGTYGGEKTISGVDKEYFTLFKTFNENDSPLLKDNIKAYGKVIDDGEIAALQADADFKKSNLKASINGRMFGNLKPMVIDLTNNRTIRWYVFGGQYTGAAIDPAAILPEGNYRVTGSSGGMNLFPAEDAGTIPAGGGTAWIDIKTGSTGKYLLYPDISALYDRGMFSIYEIKN